MLSTTTPPFREFIEKNWQDPTFCLFDIEQFINDYPAILFHIEKPSGNTILHQVLEYNCPPYLIYDIIEFLINKGASINFPNQAGMTPLHVVVKKSMHKICRLFLENNATQEPVVDGSTPLSSAVENNNETIVKLLCRFGANTDVQINGKTLLQIAVERNYKSVILLLLQYGANEENDFPDINSIIPELHYIFVIGPAYRGDLERLIKLNQQFPDIYKLRDPVFGITPFACAASNGHDDVIGWLLQQQECPIVNDIDIANNDLYDAVNGHWKISEHLNLSDANTMQKILMTAAACGQFHIIQNALYSDNSPININTGTLTRNDLFSLILRLIFLAARNGHLSTIISLSELRHLVNGRAPSMANIKDFLIVAATNGHFNVIKYLIYRYISSKEFPIRPGYLTYIHQDFTVQINQFFSWAIENDRLQIIQYLFTIGYGRKCDLIPLLPVAASHGQIILMEWLLKKKLASLYETNAAGMSALECAAENGKLVTVVWLYFHMQKSCRKNFFADVEILWPIARKAMLLASHNGHLDVVQWLITESNGSSNYRNYIENNGGKTTAILRAAAGGHLAVVKWLLQIRPDAINDRDSEGNSTFLTAVAAGTVEVVRYLLNESKVSINDQNNWQKDNGENALFMASRAYNLEMVKCLVEVDQAAVIKTNNKGETPLMVITSQEFYNRLFPRLPEVDKTMLLGDKLTGVICYLVKVQFEFYINNLSNTDDINLLRPLIDFYRFFKSLDNPTIDTRHVRYIRLQVIDATESAFLRILHNPESTPQAQATTTKLNPVVIVERVRVLFVMATIHKYPIDINRDLFYKKFHNFVSEFSQFVEQLVGDTKKQAISALVIVLKSIIANAYMKRDISPWSIARWYYLLAEFLITKQQYHEAYAIYRECSNQLGGVYADLFIAEMILNGYIDVDADVIQDVDAKKVFPENLLTTEITDEEDVTQNENNNLFVSNPNNQEILRARAIKAYAFIHAYITTEHGELLLHRINCYLAGKMPTVIARTKETATVEQWSKYSLEKFKEYYQTTPLVIDALFKQLLLLVEQSLKDLIIYFQSKTTGKTSSTDQDNSHTTHSSPLQIAMTTATNDTSKQNENNNTEKSGNNAVPSANRTDEVALNSNAVNVANAATTAPHAILFPTATPKGVVISVVTSADTREEDKLPTPGNEDRTNISTDFKSQQL